MVEPNKLDKAPGRAQGALSILDFCRWAAIGRTAAYEELKAGRLRARKCGRRTIIPMTEAERWLSALPAQST